jgi:prohibitin 2
MAKQIVDFDEDDGNRVKFMKMIGVGILLLALVIVAATSTYVVDPGFRGIKVVMGQVDGNFKPEGFGFKQPFVSSIVQMPVRQLTREVKSSCYSSDLQQVEMKLRVLYRIPEASVVRVYREYSGDPFDSLIAPRVEEALKEVVALQSAELIVKKREEIKNRTLESARQKIGDILVIADIVLVDTNLSRELEAAIEAKMVQEQEAAKAKFTQQKAQIEADTAVVKAKGEAESIRIRAEALRNNPGIIELQIVEKWDGKTPMVVGGGANGGSGTNILLPINVENARK